MTFNIKIGGHRGLGCTDSQFAIHTNPLKRPPENTLASIKAVFESSANVDFIETDLLRTQDDKIILCHSTALAEHVPEKFRPAGKFFIDELTYTEVQRLRTGPQGTGKIPSLQDLFTYIKKNRPGKGLALNLEIKDVQGTACPSRQPSLAKLALQEVKKARFPLARIRFSSFALGSIEEMARLEPKARIGMLFDVPKKYGGSIGKKMFVDREDKYLGFTPADIMKALKRVPHIENLHPEIRVLTPKTVALAAKHKLGLTTWGYMEKSPLKDAEWSNAAKRAIMLCQKYNVPLELITDYAADMRKFVGKFLKEQV